MMGEVLVDRARPVDFALELTCPACDSEVRLTAEDLSYDKWKVGGYWFAGTEVIEAHFSFECPACGGQHFIKNAESQIPQGIRIDLIDDYTDRKNSPGGSTII